MQGKSFALVCILIHRKARQLSVRKKEKKKKKHKDTAEFSFLHRNIKRKKLKGLFRILRVAGVNITSISASAISLLKSVQNCTASYGPNHCPNSHINQTVIKNLFHYFVRTLIQSKQNPKVSD